MLMNNHVLSVPILDEDGEYKGAVSVNDILRGLIRSRCRITARLHAAQQPAGRRPC